MILDFELLKADRPVLVLVSTSDSKFKIYDVEANQLKVSSTLESRVS